MVGTAFSLAIVGYVINLAMGRTLAAKHGYDVDPNQVLQGLGRPGAAPFALRRAGKSSGRAGRALRRADVLLPWRLRGFVPWEGERARCRAVLWAGEGLGRGKELQAGLSALLPLHARCFCTSQGAEQDLDSWCVT